MGRRGRRPHPDILTPREWEVLDLLRQRLSNEQIAERLGVTLNGAKYHVSQILSKLGIESREEAAAWSPPARRSWYRKLVWVGGAAAVAVAATAVALGFIIGGSFDEEGTSALLDCGGSGCEQRVDPNTVSPSSWEVSVPQSVSVGEPVRIAIRNRDASENQASAVTLHVRLPLGPRIGDSGEVRGQDWRDFDFFDTDMPGTYSVAFSGSGVEQTGNSFGHAYFTVEASEPCGAAQVPDEKSGPLKMRFGSGTVCWTDVDNEASYKVEGTVHYIGGGCDGSAGPAGSEDVPFSAILAANATSFALPRPQDPRLTFANVVTVSVEALDVSGATLLTEGTGVLQRDDFCEPSPTP